MSVFVDTGVFFAHHDTDAARHEDAIASFESLLDGAFGQPYTSDFVFDETVTLTRARTGSFDAAAKVAGRILGDGSYPDVITMLTIGRDDLRRGLDAFRRYADHDLSFTDATTIALCATHDIDAVLSFDDDFDGLVDRRVPGET